MCFSCHGLPRPPLRNAAGPREAWDSTDGLGFRVQGLGFRVAPNYPSIIPI